MTKLGIKTNILAVLMCIVGLVSGYIGALLLAGYILLVESDTSLRKTSIKVLTIMCVSSVLTSVIGLLPDFISWVSSILAVFDGSLYIGFLSTMCNILSSTVWLAETALLLLTALFAFKGKDFKFAPIDKIAGIVYEGVSTPPTDVGTGSTSNNDLG